MSRQGAASGLVGTLVAIVGALAIGTGLAGIITTATIDLAAFGSFGAFVQLATPYAYAAAALLVVAGFAFIATGSGLRAGGAYIAGVLATSLLAVAGGAALVLADRLPIEALILPVRAAGVLLILPLLLLLVTAPPARRR